MPISTNTAANTTEADGNVILQILCHKQKSIGQIEIMKRMSLDEKSDNYNSYYSSSSIISKLAHIKWCWVL